MDAFHGHWPMTQVSWVRDKGAAEQGAWALGLQWFLTSTGSHGAHREPGLRLGGFASQLINTAWEMEHKASLLLVPEGRASPQEMGHVESGQGLSSSANSSRWYPQDARHPWGCLYQLIFEWSLIQKILIEIDFYSIEENLFLFFLSVCLSLTCTYLLHWLKISWNLKLKE